MIYITGDTHIPIDIDKLSEMNFPEQSSLTKDDYVIICGDFGLLFNYKETGNTVPACPEDIRWTDKELGWYDWLNDAVRKLGKSSISNFDILIKAGHMRMVLEDGTWNLHNTRTKDIELFGSMGFVPEKSLKL